MKRALFPLLLCAAAAHAAPAPVAFTHVNLIDGRGGPVAADVTVVWSGDTITAVGPGLAPPAGARVVDGKGKFLIPGLWDMHIHWFTPKLFSLFIANGVTGVRQMFGFPIHFVWNRMIAGGQLVGPRQIVASPIVDGENAVWPGSIVVARPDQAAGAVADIKKGGFAFVKVYSRLSRDAFLAIAAEARKQGIPFAGHVPDTVNAGEASDAGQRSIEHMTGILLSASSAEAELRPARAKLVDGVTSTKGPDKAMRAELYRMNEKMLASYDEAKATALFARLAKNGTRLTPTLTVLRSMAYNRGPGYAGDPRLKYMPQGIRDGWKPENDERIASESEADLKMDQRVYQKTVSLVPLARKQGVRFLAGTDVLNPYCFPGFSLHDELALLVEAGLTPMEALQAATREPAEYLGLEKSMGTVEKGKVADLVLLDANPLDDIHNTTRIAAVVAAGRLYARADLDRLLADAAKEAARKPVGAVLLEVIEKRGVAAAVGEYRVAATKPDDYDLSEDQLNALGYELLKAKKPKDAVEILKLNADAFPKSSNAQDSLGEAYLAAGDKPAAIKCYKRALELDPKAENAARVLKTLAP